MYKVLIVDDEMIVRHAVKTLIQWEEGRFEYAGSASSGSVALDMVERMSPDIIITDIKMSEMDGIELIKRLMQTDFDGEVLVLSNYNDFDLVREALRCGAHDYMLKLTLRTEGFMAALEEMALKLDVKRHQNQAKQFSETMEQPAPEAVCEWLKQIDSGMINNDGSEGRERMLELFANRPNLQVYVFCVHVSRDCVRSQTVSEYKGTLYQIAEGLFPANHGLYVVSTDSNRYLLLTAVSGQSSSDSPSHTAELAQRMKGLSKIYYNMEVTVLYGRPAAGYEAVIEQIILNKQADYLTFYVKYMDNGIFNESIMEHSEDEAGFKVLESRLRDSLRHAQGIEIDLWLESALVLIQASADFCVQPNSLKRTLIGGVWGIAGSKVFSRGESWNESRWIKKIESADTDTSLLLTVQEMCEEILTVVGKNTGQKYMREEVRLSIAYLEKHYSERVLISDVAAHVGFSEPYLCQVFKAETGSSILTRLNEIRMAKAYEMLASGNYLIKQVALEIGIPDPFYFNRLFKKRYGMAPKTVKKTPGENKDNFKMK